jgi:hypothetical protein
MGMGRSPGGAAQLEARLHGARGDPQATLLAPGKQPGWLTAAVEEAERAVSAQSAELAADPPASEDAG